MEKHATSTFSSIYTFLQCYVSLPGVLFLVMSQPYCITQRNPTFDRLKVNLRLISTGDKMRPRGLRTHRGTISDVCGCCLGCFQRTQSAYMGSGNLIDLCLDSLWLLGSLHHQYTSSSLARPTYVYACVCLCSLDQCSTVCFC